MRPSIKLGQEDGEKPPADQLVMTVPVPSNDWREQFLKYLTTAVVPKDETEMERLIIAISTMSWLMESL